MVKNFEPSLFTLCYKVLPSYLNYIKKENYFYQHQVSKTNLEIHMKHLKVLVK